MNEGLAEPEWLYLIYKEHQAVKEVAEGVSLAAQGITTWGPWVGYQEAMLKPGLFMNKWTGVLAETIDGISFYLTGKMVPGFE